MGRIDQSDLDGIRRGDIAAIERAREFMVARGEGRAVAEHHVGRLSPGDPKAFSRVSKVVTVGPGAQRLIEGIWKALIAGLQELGPENEDAIKRIMMTGLAMSNTMQDPGKLEAFATLNMVSAVPYLPRVLPHAYIQIIHLGAILSDINSGKLQMEEGDREWFLSRSRQGLSRAMAVMGKAYAQMTEDLWMEGDDKKRKDLEKGLDALEQNTIYITDILGHICELEGKDDLDALRSGSGPMSQRVIDAAGNSRGVLRATEEREGARAQREGLLGKYSGDETPREFMFISTIYRAIDRVYASLPSRDEIERREGLVAIRQLSSFGARDSAGTSRRMERKDLEDMRHDVINALAHGLGNGDRLVRSEAIEGLCAIDCRRVGYILEKMLSRQEEGERKDELYRAIGRFRAQRRLDSVIPKGPDSIPVPRPLKGLVAIGPKPSRIVKNRP